MASRDSDSWNEWSVHVLAELERVSRLIDSLDDRIDSSDKVIVALRTEMKLFQERVDQFIKDYYSTQKDEERERRDDRRAHRGRTVAVVTCIVSALIAAGSLIVSVIKLP